MEYQAFNNAMNIVRKICMNERDVRMQIQHTYISIYM